MADENSVLSIPSWLVAAVDSCWTAGGISEVARQDFMESILDSSLTSAHMHRLFRTDGGVELSVPPVLTAETEKLARKIGDGSRESNDFLTQLLLCAAVVSRLEARNRQLVDEIGFLQEKIKGLEGE